MYEYPTMLNLLASLVKGLCGAFIGATIADNFGLIRA